MYNAEEVRLAIVGLGYVGLPLAVAFGRANSVVGYDIDRDRVQELQAGSDRTLEVTSGDLAEARQLRYTSLLEDICDC